MLKIKSFFILVMRDVIDLLDVFGAVVDEFGPGCEVIHKIHKTFSQKKWQG